MLEKFKAQPWHIQLIALVAVASVLYGAVYYFVTSDTRVEIASLNRSGRSTDRQKRSRENRHPAHQRISHTLRKQNGGI